MMDWTFQTNQTSQAWADLLRDMVPCSVRLWTSLPGWDTQWSVSRASNPSKGEFRVTLLIWPVPSTERNL